MGQLAFLSVCRIKINGLQAVCHLLSVYKGFLWTLSLKDLLRTILKNLRWVKTERGNLIQCKSTCKTVTMIFKAYNAVKKYLTAHNIMHSTLFLNSAFHVRICSKLLSL